MLGAWTAVMPQAAMMHPRAGSPHPLRADRRRACSRRPAMLRYRARQRALLSAGVPPAGHRASQWHPAR